MALQRTRRACIRADFQSREKGSSLYTGDSSMQIAIPCGSTRGFEERTEIKNDNAGRNSFGKLLNAQLLPRLPV
jgi:hypothetical protein